MQQVHNGFAHICGDQSLAEQLLDEILPEGFGDEEQIKAEGDDSLKISAENLTLYYVEYYQH